MMTITEFVKRKNQGKDPHYKTPVQDPFKLSSDDVTAIKEFLPFFLRQIDYLKFKYTKLSLQEQNVLHIYEIIINKKRTKAEQ